MSANEKHAKGHLAKNKLMNKWIKKGYYIYDECNQGPVDFIALNLNGDVRLVESKAESKRLTGKQKGKKINRILGPQQKKLNKNLKDKTFQIKVEYADVDKEMEEYKNNVETLL